MSRAAALLRAAHLAPTVAVTGLLTVVAARAGLGLRETTLVAAAVLTGQLSIGWSNDLIDLGRDRAAGRVDKPVATGAVGAGTVRAALVLAVVLCVPLSLALDPVAGSVHLVAVAGGWAYNLGLKSGPMSWLPYAVSFGLLPGVVVLALPGRPLPPWWLTVAGALLGVGAHFLNVVPDLADDLAAGVRGLPHRVGRRGAAGAGAALLGAAATVVALGPSGPRPAWVLPALGAALVPALGSGAAAWSDRSARSPLPFRLALLTAAVAVGLLVGRGPDLG